MAGGKIALVITVLLYALVRYTDLGKAMRAAAHASSTE